MPILRIVGACQELLIRSQRKYYKKIIKCWSIKKEMLIKKLLQNMNENVDCQKNVGFFSINVVHETRWLKTLVLKSICNREQNCWFLWKILVRLYDSKELLIQSKKSLVSVEECYKNINKCWFM